MGVLVAIENDNEDVHHVLRVTEETTVGKILEWWKSNHKAGTPFRGPIYLSAGDEIDRLVRELKRDA